MRILLVALNARFVQTNLAIRSLREVLKEQANEDWEVGFREFTINEQLDKIAGEIYLERPDMVGFSCYIWNINQILTLIRRLRPVLPKVYFFAGGPEVSFDSGEIMIQVPQLDAIVIGEGEISISSLIKAWSANILPWEIGGVVWRLRQGQIKQGTLAEKIVPASFTGKIQTDACDLIVINEPSLCIPDLNNLPNPYTEEEDFQGRLVYVETSRGCPYHCEFCISAASRGVRFLEPERFRLILRQLFACGARTIKFVDRTFNASKKHAFDILNVFREEAQKILAEEEMPKKDIPRAHCEMAGELLDEEWMDYLQVFPQGMIQLEIGVQSTHQPTLEAVKRSQNFTVWKDKVKFLQQDCYIPVHLDLIAGLPCEGWQEFRRSFNEVYEINPNHLQLGFLKMLKGSGLREKSMEYGLVYSPEPPYSILQTKNFSHTELLALSRAEEILERYYNSGRFKYSLAYVLQVWTSPFDFYHSFAEYWQEKRWFRQEWNSGALLKKLWDFLMESQNNKIQTEDWIVNLNKRMWQEALRFDYYLQERPGQLPSFFKKDNEVIERENNDLSQNVKNKIRERIHSDLSWRKIIPEAEKMDRRQWARATAVEYFLVDIPEVLESLSTSSHFSLNRDEIAEERGAWYLFCYSEGKRRYYKYEGDD